MISTYLNPYVDNNAVQRQEMLFDREDVVRRIYASVVNHQCFSLTGLQHTGKSSVLKHLSALFQRQGWSADPYILVPLDLRSFGHRNTHDFFSIVAEKIVAACRGRLSLEVGHSDGADEFMLLLTQIVGQGYYTVLLMDSFDKVAQNIHFDPDFFSFLRGQATEDLVSYVTVSKAPLNQICHQDVQSSPFFNIFELYHLGPLSVNGAISLIKEPLSRVECSVTSEEIDWVLEQAGCHPYFLQRVCHHFFEEKISLAHGLPLSEVQRRRVSEQTYQNLHPHFAATWNELKEEDKDQIQEELRPHYVGDRRFPEISQSGLFHRFFHEISGGQASEITVKDLESILNKKEDIRFLEECALKHLPMVDARMNEQREQAPLLRGRLIQQLLIDAHNCMRGPEPRRDASDEWKLYNILYYRYFYRRFKHDLIIHKLNTSRRQYFRDRNKALETLLNVLLEMDYDNASYG